MVRITIKKVPKYRYGKQMTYSIRENGKHVVFRDTKIEAEREAKKLRTLR